LSVCFTFRSAGQESRSPPFQHRVGACLDASDCFGWLASDHMSVIGTLRDCIWLGDVIATRRTNIQHSACPVGGGGEGISIHSIVAAARLETASVARSQRLLERWCTLLASARGELRARGTALVRAAHAIGVAVLRAKHKAPSGWRAARWIKMAAPHSADVRARTRHTRPTLTVARPSNQQSNRTQRTKPTPHACSVGMQHVPDRSSRTFRTPSTWRPAGRRSCTGSASAPAAGQVWAAARGQDRSWPARGSTVRLDLIRAGK
jgi:hypothetical protein